MWTSEAPLRRFTRHARNRMRLYHLTEADVSDALRQPDGVTPTSHGEPHAWKLIPRGWLRVTCVQEDQTTIVSTVTVRRRGPEESSAMRITYDPEADALYIELRQAMPTDSRDIEEGVTADLDTDGHVIGIELLHVRERLGHNALTSVVLEQLPLTVTHEGEA